MHPKRVCVKSQSAGEDTCGGRLVAESLATLRCDSPSFRYLKYGLRGTAAAEFRNLGGVLRRTARYDTYLLYLELLVRKAARLLLPISSTFDSLHAIHPVHPTRNGRNSLILDMFSHSRKIAGVSRADQGGTGSRNPVFPISPVLYGTSVLYEQVIPSYSKQYNVSNPCGWISLLPELLTGFWRDSER